MSIEFQDLGESRTFVFEEENKLNVWVQNIQTQKDNRENCQCSNVLSQLKTNLLIYFCEFLSHKEE
jgi:hypothetical protein